MSAERRRQQIRRAAGVRFVAGAGAGADTHYDVIYPHPAALRRHERCSVVADGRGRRLRSLAARAASVIRMEAIWLLAQDIRSQQVRHVNSCFFPIVVVDDDPRPVPVSPLRAFSPDEKRRYGAAKLRKALRQEM